MDTRDVIVVGSGGAGMTAALVAAKAGLDVLLVEKAAYFGGTTAWSGGGVWVPGNQLAKDAGLEDSADAAGRYVRELVGPTLRIDLLEAFLDAAPKMADFLQKNTAAQFELMRGFPDWRLEIEGSCRDGRLLGPLEYDGRELGERFAQLRPPLAEFNAPGGMMFALKDLGHIANATKSFKSFSHLSGLVFRYLLDRLQFPRGARLTMGNALVARLLRSALDAGVELWRSAAVVELQREHGRVSGVIVERDGLRIPISAKRGVVLAAGGFSADAEFRARHIPFAEHHVSLAAEGSTADGLRLALGVGGLMEENNLSNAGWVVMSLAEDGHGRQRKFPHLFMDRGKPGCIAVNHRGERFGNEAAMNLVEAMHASNSVPAHLICDRRFIKKYGLGLVRPGGFGLSTHLKLGYIKSAPSLAALAALIGADAAGLEAQVARANGHAAAGRDEDFGRGATPTDFAMGDRAHTPNPCLGPIETPPFYAVKIFPGDSTTTLGLRVDSKARVLGAGGHPILGLYAVGVDANSLWRGRAPANGANNTLSLTFGYIAGRSLGGANA